MHSAGKLEIKLYDLHRKQLVFGIDLNIWMHACNFFLKLL